jgi:hypothetical protein
LSVRLFGLARGWRARRITGAFPFWHFVLRKSAIGIECGCAV